MSTPTSFLFATAMLAALASVPAQTPLLRVPGEAAPDNFGWSVAPAGDLDEDGVPDIVVGAPSHASVAGFAGRAYVLSGPFTGARTAAKADAVITASTFGDNLGIAVASAGDVNDDGVADLLIGARGNDAAGIQAGRAYVFFGPVRGRLRDVDADVILEGEAFDEMGRAVAPAGDLNGDGVDDIAISSPLAAGPGEVNVFYGPLEPGRRSATTADATVSGVLFNEYFGTSIVAADLNGDGRTDLAIGGPRPPLSGSAPGRVYVFFGPLAGSHSALAADVILDGEQQSDELGSSVAAGDVNGDGVADLVAGATQFFRTGARGRAYVFHGPLAPGSRSAATANAVLLGEAPSGHFGMSVAAGDIDGDGRADVVVGADNAVQGKGRAYVFFGPVASKIAATAADMTFTGQVGDLLGQSVAHGGDLDGDGDGDLLLGAPAHPAIGSPGHAILVQPPDAVAETMASCTALAGTLAATAGAPAPGRSLTLALDQGPSAGAAALLLLAAQPAPGWPPCGTTVPGIGEILLGLAAPGPLVLPAGVWTGAPVALVLRFPRNGSLLGAQVFAQGVFVDAAPAAPEPLRLTGGLRLRVGL